MFEHQFPLEVVAGLEPHSAAVAGSGQHQRARAARTIAPTLPGPLTGFLEIRDMSRYLP
jgi:hypothetical protein